MQSGDMSLQEHASGEACLSSIMAFTSVVKSPIEYWEGCLAFANSRYVPAGTLRITCVLRRQRRDAADPSDYIFYPT
jgi:hypothetical protein